MNLPLQIVKKFLRILRKFLFWIFFVCLFLLTTVTVLLHIYQDDIKAYAIEAINKHLKTPLEVRGIELSFFHDFPRASLEFKDVLIHDAYETQQSEDTLIYAHRMYLTFNVWDIWNGDYTVKRLAMEDARLNLRVNRGGEVNYDILKDAEENPEDPETNFAFRLEMLRFDRLAFTYSNHATSQYYKIDIIKGLAKGEFDASEFELKSESEIYVRKIKSNSITLLRNKPGRVELDMQANTETGTYIFSRGDIILGQMPFELSGQIDTARIDLSIRGKEIELADLANTLAAGTMPDATRYQGTGILNFESYISGPVSSTDMPSITADFRLDDGTLTNPSNNLKIYDVNLEGSYANEQKGRKEKLTFSALKLKLLDSFFNGKGDVENFAQPKIDATVSGDLDLASFHRFFRLPEVDEIGGKVKLNLDIQMQFFDPEYRSEKFQVYHSKGQLTMQNVIFSRSGDDLVYQDINGEMIIHDNDASIRDFKFKTGKSDLLLNGALSNLVGYVTGNGGLGIVAALESEHIDLNEFIGETENEADGELEKFILPADLNLNVDLQVYDMKWDNHRFEAITGKLLMANRKVTAKNFRLKTVEGEIRGGLTLNNLVEAGNVIEGNLEYSGINIRTLFSEWENFDQETVTDKHISGTAKGSIDLLLFFNPYFSIIEDKIFAMTDLQIENGALKDLETMKLITDYMRTNKGLKILLNKHIDKFEEKLLNLQFKTLKNTIEIKDRRIIIPEMLISSNALDVKLFGWHDFDNNVEYHFSFRFRELKTVAEYTEFGKIEDDGLGLVIYLTMKGSIEEPEFSLDSDERKNDIRESVAEEKNTVKSILKTEFGLFKSDTTVQRMNVNNSKQVEFIYYEEDSEDSDTVSVKKNKPRTLKWANTLKEKSDKEREFEEKEFEDDY